MFGLNKSIKIISIRTTIIPKYYFIAYIVLFFVCSVKRDSFLCFVLVGQQLSGRPEEEKPLSELQWAGRNPANSDFPSAGFSFSSDPAAGWDQPHWLIRSHPLPHDLRPLQPGLLVHLPGQRHYGESQVSIPANIRMQDTISWNLSWNIKHFQVKFILSLHV